MRKSFKYRDRVRTHGRAYSVWCSMRNRCLKPNRKEFKYYGARGITICEEWHVFANFLRDMGQPKEGQSLDRIDNNLGYSKPNCRWATQIEQARNKRNNRMVQFKGRTLTLQEWANELRVDRSTIHRRLDAGVPVPLAFSVFKLTGNREPLKRKAEL